MEALSYVYPAHASSVLFPHAFLQRCTELSLAQANQGPTTELSSAPGLVFLSVPSNFQTRTQSFDGRQAGEGEGTQAQVGCLQIRTQYESMPGEHMGSHQLLGSLGPCLLQQARSFQEVRLTRTESPEKKKKKKKAYGLA